MDQDQHALGAAPGGEIVAHAPPGPLVGEGHASGPDLESALETVFAALSAEAEASFAADAEDTERLTLESLQNFDKAAFWRKHAGGPGVERGQNPTLCRMLCMNAGVADGEDPTQHIAFRSMTSSLCSWLAARRPPGSGGGGAAKGQWTSELGKARALAQLVTSASPMAVDLENEAGLGGLSSNMLYEDRDSIVAGLNEAVAKKDWLLPPGKLTFVFYDNVGKQGKKQRDARADKKLRISTVCGTTALVMDVPSDAARAALEGRKLHPDLWDRQPHVVCAERRDNETLNVDGAPFYAVPLPVEEAAMKESLTLYLETLLDKVKEQHSCTDDGSWTDNIDAAVAKSREKPEEPFPRRPCQNDLCSEKGVWQAYKEEPTFKCRTCRTRLPNSMEMARLQAGGDGQFQERAAPKRQKVSTDLLRSTVIGGQFQMFQVTAEEQVAQGSQYGVGAKARLGVPARGVVDFKQLPCPGLMANPAGYVVLKDLVDRVLDMSGIPQGTGEPPKVGRHRVVFMGSDGLPGLILHKILRAEEDFSRRRCVIQIPGLGHEKWIYWQAVIGVLMEAVGGELLKAAGFKTPKQQNLMASVGDKHKFIQVLQMQQDAIAMEMLTFYVRSVGTDIATVGGFLEYLEGMVDPVLKVHAEIVLNWGNAIRLLDFSEDYAWWDGIQAARKFLLPILWSRHHTGCAPLVALDLLHLWCAPEELIEIRRHAVTLSKSKREDGHQALDLLQEEYNAKVKPLAAGDTPNAWQFALTYVDHLMRVRGGVMGDAAQRKVERKAGRKRTAPPMEFTVEQMRIAARKVAVDGKPFYHPQGANREPTNLDGALFYPDNVTRLRETGGEAMVKYTTHEMCSRAAPAKSYAMKPAVLVSPAEEANRKKAGRKKAPTPPCR